MGEGWILEEISRSRAWRLQRSLCPSCGSGQSPVGQPRTKAVVPTSAPGCDAARGRGGQGDRHAPPCVLGEADPSPFGSLPCGPSPLPLHRSPWTAAAAHLQVLNAPQSTRRRSLGLSTSRLQVSPQPPSASIRSHARQTHPQKSLGIPRTQRVPRTRGCRREAPAWKGSPGIATVLLLVLKSKRPKPGWEEAGLSRGS